MLPEAAAQAFALLTPKTGTSKPSPEHMAEQAASRQLHLQVTQRRRRAAPQAAAPQAVGAADAEAGGQAERVQGGEAAPLQNSVLCHRRRQIEDAQQGGARAAEEGWAPQQLLHCIHQPLLLGPLRRVAALDCWGRWRQLQLCAGRPRCGGQAKGVGR